MKGQTGSVLIGVIALSLAMSIAAGGFILLSANTAKDGLSSAADIQLHYAAESGMHMGVSWTRNYDAAKINDPTWEDGFVMTRVGGDDYQNLNGYLVKVSIHMNGAKHSLSSIATKDIGQPYLEITQDIDKATNIVGGVAPLLSTPVLSNWVETYHK